MSDLFFGLLIQVSLGFKYAITLVRTMKIVSMTVNVVIDHLLEKGHKTSKRETNNYLVSLQWKELPFDDHELPLQL